MKFTWDLHKNILNIKKHRLSFEEAVFVFEQALIEYDKEHSVFGEDRYKAIGRIHKHGWTIVVFVEIKDDYIRIISARKATKQEVKKYENT